MAALGKPEEAVGRQSTDWLLQPQPQGAATVTWLKRGRPQDVGNRRGLGDICHLKEAKRPPLPLPSQLRVDRF